MKKKALLSSILVIVMCVSIIAGSTLALFTSQDGVNIAVTAGNVELSADLVGSSMQTWSAPFVDSVYEKHNAVADGDEYYSVFDNGGEARILSDKTNLVITKMTPGDVVKLTVDVTNSSNVNVEYRVRMVSTRGASDKPDLTDVLVTTAKIDGNVYEVSQITSDERATPWCFIEKDAPISDFEITVSFPDDGISIDENGNLVHNNRDNQYKNGEANIAFVVEAVQANGVPADVPANIDDMLDAGYIKVGNYDGKGANLSVAGNTLGLAGKVNLAGITLDGSALAQYDTLKASTGANVALTLNENSAIIAPAVADTTKVYSAINFERTSYTKDTVIINDGSKITSGDGSYAIYATSTEGGFISVVLNGASCLEDTDGKALAFYGQADKYYNVKIFVKDAASLAQYESMVDAEYAVIEWYVDGVYAKTVRCN